MNEITPEALKEKLDRGDDFKLAMVLGDSQFRLKHIPGSLNIHTLELAAELLHPDDEIVIYCSSDVCRASRHTYSRLEARGYSNLQRLIDGIYGWEKAGYPLEGEWAK
jgi:rhodanese-related sulfurtransferase